MEQAQMQNRVQDRLPDVTVTKLEYKGIKGVLHQRTVAEDTVDAQIARLVEKFGCANAQELVQRVEGYETLAQMKDELRTARQAQYDALERTALEKRLLTKVAQNMECTLPIAYLNKRAMAVIEAREKTYQKQRTNLDAYLKTVHKTRAAYEREVFLEEELLLRQHVCLKEIAKQENIMVSAQEIAQEYQNIAAVRSTPLEEAKRGLTEATVVHALTVRKVYALLVEYAQLTTEAQ